MKGTMLQSTTPKSDHALVLAMLCVALSACSQQLTERSVSKFIDAADQDFLDGNAAALCVKRGKDFLLTASNFDLTRDKIVADLAAAEAVAAEREAAGERVSAEIQTVTRQSLCLDSLLDARTYRKATLQRGKLDIRIDPDGQRAVVLAHYTVRQPVVGQRDSSLSMRDVVEHQIATRQTESDDESVLIIDGDGDIVFASTKAQSRSFLIPSQRDARL